MLHGEHQQQVVADVSGGQEVFLDVLVPGGAHGVPELGVTEQLDGTVGRTLRRVHEEPGHAVEQLQPDAADRAADDRFLLPERLGHRQSEPFLERLLHHDGRAADQGVDVEIAERGQLQHVDVRVVPGRLADLAQDLRAFGVVRCPTTGQQQLTVVASSHQAIRVHDPDRILQPVESGDLRQNRPVRVEAIPFHDRSHLLVG